MDWLANGLPTAGARATERRAGSLARRDVPTCRPTDSLAEARRRIGSGWDQCVVVWDGGVVAGRARRDALTGEPSAPVESVMERAPQTVRPSLGLEDLRDALAGDTPSVLVTGSDGQLLGIVRREDLR